MINSSKYFIVRRQKNEQKVTFVRLPILKKFINILKKSISKTSDIQNTHFNVVRYYTRKGKFNRQKNNII